MQDQPNIKFVSKGWGFEKIICNDKYCGKLLYFAKGKRCSLHYHKIKDEVFFIHSGRIRVYYSDSISSLEKWLKGMKKEQGSVNNDQLFAMMVSMLSTHGNQSWLQVKILNRGDNFHVPPGRVHQMIALEDTELYEFSTTHYDEDSYRIIKGD